MGLIPNNPWVAHGVDPEFFYGPLPPGPRVSGQWMALSPWYLLAFVLLLIGGLGTTAFSNMQTTLILTETPPATRSRVMGTSRRSSFILSVRLAGLLLEEAQAVRGTLNLH